MTITIEDAQEAIRRGAFYGDVYELLAEADREALKQWYLHEPGLPNLAARERPAPAPGPACERPLKEISGRPNKKHTTFIDLNPCSRCGSSEFVPGSCPTCANCGESSGGCG